MNYKLLTKMGIRLIALYYFMNYMVFAVSSVITVIEILRQPGESGSIGVLSAVTPMILMVVISILLWIYAEKISDKLIGDAQIEGMAQNIDYNKVQYLAFCIAGILIIGKAVPDLFSSIYQIISISNLQISNLTRTLYSQYSKVIGAVIQMILGCWLVLGTNGIINLIKKLRTAGINEESN